MWLKLGRFILKYRILLLLILALTTTIMGYWASKVRLSYEPARAIPIDHPKYIAYQEFLKKFGEDGNLLVIGIQTDSLFEEKLFNNYATLQRNLEKHDGVADVIAITSAINLEKLPETETLKADTIFPERILTQTEIDSGSTIFLSLPFYRNLIYNPTTNAWLMGVRINKEIMNSRNRIAIVEDIKHIAETFGKDNNLPVYLSGLPLIRTEMSQRISGEMRWFLLASMILSAVILVLFFRSFSSMLLSLAVVIIGVLFSFGTMHLLGYKINILTALIPPLIVVIGIPNCIYFLNKFHTSYNKIGDKRKALVEMVSTMGVVTLFCNLAAAIGFAVFALTRSQVLKEFGEVAGINILMLFFISLILIPTVLSFLPPPATRHTKYLQNPGLNNWLGRLERWSLNHRKLIYAVTLGIVIIAVAGVFKLKTVGYIVDDLPKSDKIYTDLKFFEKNFKGIMPLEIVVDTKKKYGVSRNLNNLQRIDSLSQFLISMPSIAKPLSIVEGLKFAKQAFFDGDSNNYTMPAEYDLPALSQYLNFRGDTSNGVQHSAKKNSLAQLVSTFMDSDKQQARISVSMEDVGSKRLPYILDSIQKRANQLFNNKNCKDCEVMLTGSSVTFLEGS
ncbi:MAG: MMPL family transporter, partial [Bacteroidia bacterium]|nr:MMPL family transporter [Bacteroidia bacterium]